MRLFKALLGVIAFHLPAPRILINTIHRLRGVRIHSLRNTVIAYHVMLDLIYPEMIEIEEGAWITQQCKLLTHFRPTPMQQAIIGGDRVRPIKIGAGAYLGVGSIVLPGVTIGRLAVVGAGSVVTRDVPPETVVAGNPAQVIKSIQELTLADPQACEPLRHSL